MSPAESFQSITTAFSSDAPRTASSTVPTGQARAAAVALLDAACRAAARKDWSADLMFAGPGVAAESAALRTAAMAFVLMRKADLPPEQVIVELKATVNSLLLKHGYWQDQRAIRSIVFAAFLASYYDDVEYR